MNLMGGSGVGKSKICNLAIQDMGMGRYQKQLFVLAGFGWLAGRLMTSRLSLILGSSPIFKLIYPPRQ